MLKRKRNIFQEKHRKAPAPFLISCPASYYKQCSLWVAPCSYSVFFPVLLDHNCHSLPLITPPWLKVQRMAFVWQIKGRQSSEGMHCCYADSTNIMWLALLVSVKAKASVISTRDNHERTVLQTRMSDLLHKYFIFKLAMCSKWYQIKVSKYSIKIPFMVLLK